MPEVIADTSVLQYLYQTDHLQLLRALYERILVPRGVAEEIAEGRSLGHPLPDLDALSWVTVVSAHERHGLKLSADLGEGERQALALAADHPGATVLLDDALARRMAERLGIAFTGTLGVLLRAKAAGHLTSIAPVVHELEERGFRLARETRSAILELAGEE